MIGYMTEKELKVIANRDGGWVARERAMKEEAKQDLRAGRYNAVLWDCFRMHGLDISCPDFSSMDDDELYEAYKPILALILNIVECDGGGSQFYDIDDIDGILEYYRFDHSIAPMNPYHPLFLIHVMLLAFRPMNYELITVEEEDGSKHPICEEEYNTLSLMAELEKFDFLSAIT